MKKIFAMLAIMLFTAGSAFAATTISSGGSVTSSGTVIAKVSNKVGGTITSSATRFATALKHQNGTRNFATSSTDPKIYYTAVTDTKKGTLTLEITLSASDTSNFSSWTAL